LAYSSVTSVMRDPKTGGWRMWGAGMTTRDKGDTGVGLTAYTSPDGFDWQPSMQKHPVDKNATAATSRAAIFPTAVTEEMGNLPHRKS
jgi:hypothetical protein